MLNAGSSFAADPSVTVSELAMPREGDHARMSITMSSARLSTRSAHSPIRRALTGEGIHYDVHTEPGVVDRIEALALGMVIPLRAIVLAAVQQSDVPVSHNSLKRLVDEIVTPSVQLLASRRRPIIELEECAIQLVVVGNIDWLTQRQRYLLERRLVKHAIDVVVMIVHEDHSATIRELPDV